MHARMSGSGFALSQTQPNVTRHVSFYQSVSSDDTSTVAAASVRGPPARSFTLTPPLPSSASSVGRVNSRNSSIASVRSQKPHSGKGHRGAKGKGAPLRPLVTASSNPRQWVLALNAPSASADAEAGERASSSSSSPAPSPTTTKDGVQPQGNDGCRTPALNDAADALLPATPPLEERIGLHELKLIMRAFRDPASTQALDLAATTAAPPARVPSATPLMGTPRREKLPYFIGGDGLLQTHVELRDVDELSSTVAELLDAEDMAAAAATTHVSTSSHDAASYGKAVAAVPDTVTPSLTTAATTPPSTAASVPVLRNLSRQDFARVLQRAVPSATLPEIHALLAKAISETQDTVSWNELATFLVTCSRQKDDLAMEDQRFVLAGQPAHLHFEEQHGESITCVAVSKQRRLIVTGCSGGSVRAWSSGGDLAYRGVLLKIDGWVVGLHWGCRDRVLYVVTMDRYVYVLEGTTYEVLRVYHGRGIRSTADSITYATETLGKMHVGGIALPKHHPTSERGYAGARLPMGSGARADTRRSGSRGKGESGSARMKRLLSSAMQMRRGVQPNAEEGEGENVGGGGTTAAAAAAAMRANATAVAAAAFTGDESQLDASVGGGGDGDAAATNTGTLVTSYTLTTAGAAEALHQDNTPLTGAGRGPYVEQQVDEGVLTSLVDAVTATAFAETAFQEDALILGTSKGDAYLFILAAQYDLTQRRVLIARHFFTQLHRGPITKLDLSRASNALLSSGEDGRVRVTSLIAGQTVRTFYAPELPEQHASVTDFAVNHELKMLLTIGPERRALVWEWNQPTPIAVLESVNRPLCCGAFLGEQLLTVSRDRVLHVYDCKSFRLRQELALGAAGSLTRFSNTSGSASAGLSSCGIAQLYVDPARQRVLGFARFPFALCVKRQVSSGCPARYRGHHAPMLTTLVSRAFGQLVTVGADGVIMTWTPRSGANEFSFLLSNFSNASATTGAPMPPATVSMDALQRRLLTGFAGGVMVVWNILNGQVERVLTAATTGMTAQTSRGAGAGGAGRLGSAGQRARTAAGAPTAPKRAVTAVGSFLRYRALSYLFAVGRVLYVDAATPPPPPPSATTTSSYGHGAGGEGSVAGPQLGEYTTTYPSAWTPHPMYGEVTQLLQLSPQHVGCGTTSGAVLVYNVLSDCQEGAPLWVQEAMLYPYPAAASPLSASPGSTLRGGANLLAGSQRGRSPSGRPTGNGSVEDSGTLRGAMSSAMGHPGTMSGEPAPLQRSQLHSSHSIAGQQQQQQQQVVCDEEGGGSGGGLLVGQRGRVVARTIRLLTLPSVHARLLVMAQEDGTLSCWHTLRRVCLGAVNLTAVGVEEEEDDGEGDGPLSHSQREDRPPGSFVFDMDDTAGELLVFGDAEGNVHVCRVAWQVLTESAEQVAAIALPNPALYTVTPAALAAAGGCAAGAPSVRFTNVPSTAKDVGDVSRRGEAGVAEEEEEEAENAADAEPTTPTSAITPDFNEAQRAIPVLRKLERVHVFSSGLALAALRIVDADAETALSTAAPGRAAAPTDDGVTDVLSDGGGATSAAASRPHAQGRSPRRLLVVCTGADHYVRVFTLAGVPVGELGMDEWAVADPRTYRYMGELMGLPPAPLPCSLQGNPNWQQCSSAARREGPCYFNYLTDLYAAHYYSRAGLQSAGSRASARHGKTSLAATLTARRVTGAAAGQNTAPMDLLHALPFERVSSPTTAAMAAGEGRVASASPERRSTMQLHAAALMSADVPAGDAVAFTDDGVAVTVEDARQRSPLASATPRCLSTRLHRSTRYRYRVSDVRQSGVVKHDCVAALLRSRSGHKLTSAGTRPAAPGSPASQQDVGNGGSGSTEFAASVQLAPLQRVNMSVLPLPADNDDHFNASRLAETCDTDVFPGSDGDGVASRRISVELPLGPATRRRCSTASTRLPTSPGSTLQELPPRKTDGLASSTTGGSGSSVEQLLPDRPSTAGVGRAERRNVEESPLGATNTAAVRRSLAAATALSAHATPSSPERRTRGFFPSIAPHTPTSPERSPSPSAAAARESHRAPASPTLARNTSAWTANSASETSAAGAAPAAGAAAYASSSVSVVSMLSRERTRLFENSRTTAARDQISALSIPTLSAAQGAATAVAGTTPSRSPQKKNNASSPTASAQSRRNVQQHIDALLEQRRTRQVCGVSPTAEMRRSAEGFVAHMTAQLYVAPMQHTVSPALTKQQRQASSITSMASSSVPSLHPRPRPQAGPSF